MKIKALAAIVALTISSIGIAQAQGVYAGVGYSQVNGDGGGFTVKPTQAIFKLGYAFDKMWAVEGRIGAGGSSDTVRISGIDVEAKIDNFTAIYAKGSLPLGEQFGVYGLLGFNKATVKASARGFSSSETKDSSSYGLGAEFNITNNIGLSAEWVRHFSDTTSVTFAANYKF